MATYQTFSNDSDRPNVTGFFRTDGVNTSDLIDQVSHIDYHVCNKMGTSIPTLFARMFLFQSAYDDIVLLEQRQINNQNVYQGVAHNYVINTETGDRYANVYHYLISEHLDMLEFLFMYGKDIQVQKWRYSEFKDCWLKYNPYPDYENEPVLKGLKRLSDAIEAACNGTPILRDNNAVDMDILLFKYKDAFVGGTSPSLMAFTSPNWKAEMNERGWDFNGLFNDNTPRPLHTRSLPFRKLLTLMALGNMLNANPAIAKFKQYIIDNKDNGYDDEIRTWWNGLIANYGVQRVADWAPQEIEKIAEPILWDEENEPKSVISPIEGVTIYKQIKDPTFTTEYKIAPTRDRNLWNQETVNGASVVLKDAPMLIVPNGINNAYYFERERWDAATRIPTYTELCNLYLSQREVPGKGITYPIITADDLLEDKIVELAYNIDKEHFFTACSENCNFMLPIKKMYFRFFKLDDLKKHLKITLKRDRDNVIERVTVSLTIPMECTRVGTYTISRTYTYDDDATYRIVSCRKGSDAFNLGIFPFYKSTQKPQLNSYRFMLGETSTKVSVCKLGLFDKSGFVLAQDGDGGEGGEGKQLSFEQRSSRQMLSTKFATFDGSFDYIEISLQTAKGDAASGIFIPTMPVIDGGKDYKWKYAVDFGTSNTHVVMVESNAAATNARSFEYTSEHPQMVTLSSTNGNKFGVFDDDALREFVPKAFSLGEKELVKFPIRSVLYEKDSAKKDANLFTERNVGFNHKREVSNTFQGNSYISDLKWNIDNQASFKARVDAYCYQLMWMLRNHSLTHGGTEKIEVAVTYPLAMRPEQLRTIKDVWKAAWDALVNLDGTTPFPQRSFMIESVAPYKYSAVIYTELNRTDAYINMDIGGGSTDILYYKEGVFGRATKSRAYSVFFAANDLWGTGIDPQYRNVKENGFIQNLEKGIEPSRLLEIESYKGVASNASDVVTYLFSKPKEYHFADSIRQSPIASVVVVHFAALIYYLANIIKTDGLEPPACINFTGMGSKYIDIIIGSNEELLHIVKAIFKYVGVEPSNLMITREKSPKEVTALGAAFMLDPQSAHVESPKSVTLYCVDGEDDLEDAITYDDTTKGDKIWNMTYKEIEKFTTMLKSQDFVSEIRKVGIMYSYEDLVANKFDLNSFQSSYVIMTGGFGKMSQEAKKSPLTDAPFFWALKDTLYRVALLMAKQGNKNA